LEKLGGPGQINAEFSARYTQNFDGDRQALNRTGVSITAAGSWKAETWRARAGVNFYDYVNQEFSDRVWADVSRRVGKDWWAGIEAAQIHRGGARIIGQPNNETAVLLTFRHDFAIAVPWLPTRGQVTGRVFDDINNNGRQDPGEPGLGGMKVTVGSSKALTGADGQFSFSPTASGTYPVVVTSPEDLHYEQSTGHPTEKTVLNKGAITQLAIGLAKPTACEGIVRFVRKTSEATTAVDEQPVDLSTLEIIATDAAGRTGFSRFTSCLVITTSASIPRLSGQSKT
jgi:SdrD B-like domain